MSNTSKQNRWTLEEDKLLRELAAQGYTTRVISESLPGRNRLAVIGRAHRIGAGLNVANKGWGCKPVRRNAQPIASVAKSPIERQREIAKQQAVAVVKPPAPRTRSKASYAPNPTPFLQSNSHQCRYPLWDEPSVPLEQKMVCGAEGFPWCEHHLRVIAG